MLNYESITHFLEKGEFLESANLVGELLEESPDDIDLIIGYYSIKYWQNRENLISNYKNKPIEFLLEEWEKFEAKLKEKHYKHNYLTLIIKKFIILKITQQLRNKFNKEGLEQKDFPFLVSLSKQLLSIHDFQSTKEILSYCIRLNSYNPLVYFYLGDTYCLEAELTNNIKLYSRGLSYIRDGFLIAANDFPIEEVQSRIITNIIKELNFLYEGQTERIQYWISVYILLKSFYPELRKLTPDEITDIENEIQRLEKELQSVSKKFYEKILARLVFFYLVILHSLLFHYSDEERFKEILEILEQISPKIYNEVIRILSKET